MLQPTNPGIEGSPSLEAAHYDIMVQTHEQIIPGEELVRQRTIARGIEWGVDNWRRTVAVALSSFVLINTVANPEGVKTVIQKGGDVASQAYDNAKVSINGVDEVPQPMASLSIKIKANKTDTVVITAPESTSQKATLNEFKADKEKANVLLDEIAESDRQGATVTKLRLSGRASDDWLGRGTASLGSPDKGNVQLAAARASAFAAAIKDEAKDRDMKLPEIEYGEAKETVLNKAEISKLDRLKGGKAALIAAHRAGTLKDKVANRLITKLIDRKQAVVAQLIKQPITITAAMNAADPVAISARTDSDSPKHPYNWHFVPLFIPWVRRLPRYRRIIEPALMAPDRHVFTHKVTATSRGSVHVGGKEVENVTRKMSYIDEDHRQHDVRLVLDEINLLTMSTEEIDALAAALPAILQAQSGSMEASVDVKVPQR